MYCRDNFQPCVDIVLKNGPTLGASHQAWQARVNELIWPSPGGIGVVDKALWDQTVSVATSQKVVTAAPDADAYSNTYVQKAVDALKAERRGRDRHVVQGARGDPSRRAASRERRARTSPGNRPGDVLAVNRTSARGGPWSGRWCSAGGRQAPGL